MFSLYIHNKWFYSFCISLRTRICPSFSTRYKPHNKQGIYRTLYHWPSDLSTYTKFNIIDKSNLVKTAILIAILRVVSWGRTTLSNWNLRLNIPKVGVFYPYIAICTVIIRNIGSPVFSKLKTSIVFKNFTSFSESTKLRFDCFNKTFTSYCYYAFSPLSLSVIITIREWFIYHFFVSFLEGIDVPKPANSTSFW